MSYNRMAPHLLPEVRDPREDLSQAIRLEATGQIYLPVERLTPLTVAAFRKRYPRGLMLTSPDGNLIIRFKVPLTQMHKNLLEILLTKAVPHYPMDGTKAPVFFFTGYWLTRQLGIPDDYQQLDGLIEYLQMAMVTVVTKKPRYRKNRRGLIINAGVFEASPGEVDTLGIKVSGTEFERMSYVQFNDSYLHAFGYDKNLRYPNFVTKIVQLSHPVLQAIARYAMAHDNLNLTLFDWDDGGKSKAGLLTQVGIYGQTAQYKARAILLKRIGELAQFGLSLEVQKNRKGHYYLLKRGHLKGMYFGDPPPVVAARATVKAIPSDTTEKSTAPSLPTRGPLDTVITRQINELLEKTANSANEERIQAVRQFVQDACFHVHDDVIKQGGTKDAAWDAFQQRLAIIVATPQLHQFMGKHEFHPEFRRPESAGGEETTDLDDLI